MNIKFEKRGEVYVVHITEMLRRTELDEVKAHLLARVKEDEKFDVLTIIGERFISLGGTIDWDDENKDDEFLQKRLNKLAVIGDEKWRERAFSFMSGGTIPITIKYFVMEEEEQAMAWLAE